MKKLRRISIGSAQIDVANIEEAVNLVLDRMKYGLRTCVAPVNAASVVKTSHHPEFRRCLREFDLLLADGMWPALAATCLYWSYVPHSNTLPFLVTLFRNSFPDKLKVYLLGARQEIVCKAAENLEYIYPNADLVGYENGYFGLHDEDRVVSNINNSKANTLLLGISSPKKEVFVRSHWDELEIPLTIGVGGLFDILAGQIKEAPEWMRKYGFEWFFRLCHEPRRLCKRYTITNLQFIFIVLKQAQDRIFSRY